MNEINNQPGFPQGGGSTPPQNSVNAGPGVPANPAPATPVAGAGSPAQATPAPAANSHSNAQPAAGGAQAFTPPPGAPGQGSGQGFQRTPPPAGNKKLFTGLLIGAVIGSLLGGVVGGSVAVLAGAGAKDVVNTVTHSTVTKPGKPKSAEDLSGVAAIAAEQTKSVVTLEVITPEVAGSGSGVIYTADGYIITNAHVVAPEGNTEGKITVRMSDGKLLPGKLVGLDPYSDLAVVKVDAADLNPITVGDSTALNVGDLTVAIGAPLDLPNTVTTGVVSTLHRGISVGSALLDGPAPQEEPQRNPWQFEFGNPDQRDTPQQRQPQQRSSRVTLSVIQTDASINPGNSGGALLNGAGELIGINVAIVSTGASPDGNAGSVGLGFAIPSNMVKRVADSLIKGEKPSHGLLGASVADATAAQDATHAGGLITEIVPGSPAAGAGLQPGDIITDINGLPAADGTAVSGLIRMHAGGSEITITFIRDGKEQQKKLKLGTL